MAIESVNITFNDDSPPYDTVSSGGCRSGIGGKYYDDPSNYNIPGGTASLSSNTVGSAIKEFVSSGEQNKYFNYGAITFDYEINVPSNGCDGEYWVLCSQRANGGEVKSQVIAQGGAGTATFNCINIEGSSIVIGAWIFNVAAGSTSDQISITIKNIRISLVPDVENVFNGDASIDLIGNGCAVAKLAIKYGKGGEWLYAGDVGGNKSSIQIKQIEQDTYVMVDFELDCGKGICGSPPTDTTTVSADSNISPPGSVLVPNGCGESFCARPPKHIGDMYEVCTSLQYAYPCVKYKTRIIKDCPVITICEKVPYNCRTYGKCLEWRLQWCGTYEDPDYPGGVWCGWVTQVDGNKSWECYYYGPVGPWVRNKWCWVCVRDTTYTHCNYANLCHQKPDPDCSPTTEHVCVETKKTYNGCNKLANIVVSPKTSIDDVAKIAGYPSDWRETGTSIPRYIGPVMDTVIDIQVEGWSPSMPSPPWSPTCGLCVGYMVGPAWSLPIECTQKDEEVINPPEMDPPEENIRQSINNITPQAGAL